MPFDPKESSNARAEIGSVTDSAAASASSEEHADSPALRDLRGPQDAVGRSATASQPFTFDDVVGKPLRPRRHVAPIPGAVLHSIMERRGSRPPFAANDRVYRDLEGRAMGGIVGFSICLIVCILIGILLATGGVL